MNNNYLVIGAGLSGCTIANLLCKLNNDAVVTIVEKRNEVGGNCADGAISFNNFSNQIIVQKYGPHIFHTNNEKVWNYLSQFTDWIPFFVKLQASVFGINAPIPFNLNSLYNFFSSNMATEIEKKLIDVFGYGAEIKILDLISINEPLIKYISDFILNNYFKNYVLKQWGTSYDNIDKSIMARVPVNISRDDRYFKDKYQGIPRLGFSQMFKNMLSNERIHIVLNSDIRAFISNKFNTSLSKLTTPENVINCLKNKYSKIYVTSSIDEFYDYKYGVLPYRSLDFKYDYLPIKSFQSVAVTSYPNNFDFTRITEYKKIYTQFSDLDYTVIGYEYPNNFDLEKGERFYPISNFENNSLYEKYLSISKNDKSIIFVGRLGNYKYLNMDTVIERIFSMFSI